MNAPLTLVSHVLCPYAQRAAIVLHEKGATYDRINIDLSNKPAWFQLVSPLGKTPVLLVRNVPIFESAVICEYLDDTINPPLHPFNAVQRAHHRSWIEFASALLNLIGGLYSALHEDALARKAEELTDRLVQLEAQLGTGSYFSGEQFALVDAAFAPVFRYFDVFEEIADFGFFDGKPKLQAWRRALAARPSVIAAVSPDYPALLRDFLLKRGSALSARLLAASAPVAA